MVGTPGGRVPGGLVTLSRLQGRANGLPYRLPVDGALQLLSQASHDATVADEWCTFAQNTYPLMHGRVPELLRGFLQAKRAHGSAVEKAVYARMTPVELVTRFLTRRPLAFLNESDDYRLTDGRTGSGGWDAIGTAEEGSLRLSELMSYDEIALAALVGVSVPTHFINKGGRFNLGEPDRPGTQPLSSVRSSQGRTGRLAPLWRVAAPRRRHPRGLSSDLAPFRQAPSSGRASTWGWSARGSSGRA